MSDLTPAQFARIQQVYLDLADTPAADRTAKARALLGDDPVLLQEFHALPVNDSIPTAFLEPPGPRPTDTQASHFETIGPMVGKYRLLSQLGEGGFGLVYEAEQSEPVRRRVAVKVIKPGMDSRAVITRFTAERQALALMDHPSIARVFDGGSTGTESGHPGLPYFVMELVRGDSITTFCDRERLTLDRRLELMIDVCEAVQHAHLKGVIHRDIKPSNVLVFYQDGRPMPKVIDFGVAKAVGHGLTESPLITHRGQLIGTPAYMSPEQAEMSGVDIDSRTDIYSLGVLLYEVLTSRPPFDPETLRSAGPAEMVRIIREVEPPRPSTRLGTLLRTREGDDSAVAIARARRAELSALTKRLRTDLDWVVMKCLQKERDHRYTTARELAEELRRILRHEPVLAGPPRVAYRARKFVRRHRASIIWSSALLLVLAGGLGAAMHARSELELTRRQLKDMTNRSALLTGDPKIDPVGFVKLEVDPWVSDTIKTMAPASDQVGPQASQRYEQLIVSAQQLLVFPVQRDESARLSICKLLLLHGDALASLRRDGPQDLETAERCYQQAITILAATQSRSRSLEIVVMESRALSGLGDVYRASDASRSVVQYRQALAVLDQATGLSAEEKADLDRARSRARRDLAIASARLCSVTDAELLADQVLAERQQAAMGLPAGTPVWFRSQRDLAVGHTTMSDVQRLMGRSPQAAQYARSALAIREEILPAVRELSKLTTSDGEWAARNLLSFERDVPASRLVLAYALIAGEQWAEASAVLEAADQELSDLAALEPDDQRMTRTLLDCVLARADVMTRLGDPQSALAYAVRGEQLRLRLAPGWYRNYEYNCLTKLVAGKSLHLLSRDEEAIWQLTEASTLAADMSRRDSLRIEWYRRLAEANLELAQAYLPSSPEKARMAAMQAEAAYKSAGNGDFLCGVSPRDRLAPRAFLDALDAAANP